MERIIADASVIIKFFINELYSKQARSLMEAFARKEVELLEPSLLLYEVINGVRYSRAKKFTESEIKVVIESMLNFDFRWLDMNGEIAYSAAEISLHYNLSFYDASYIALAKAMDADLYTADTKLIEASGLPFVKHIKNLRFA
ncbi:MAG: type II toxin-antitoxin system VapC family toxin [Candidatus Micrarchaeia archaeon]